MTTYLVRRIGFRPQEVVIVSLAIVLIAITFPFMFQRGLIWEWVLMTLVCLLLSIFTLKWQEPKAFKPELAELAAAKDDRDLSNPHTELYIEDVDPETVEHSSETESDDLIMDSPRTSISIAMGALEDPSPSNSLADENLFYQPEVIDNLSQDRNESRGFDEGLEHNEQDFSLETLLDQGFAAKANGDFASAVSWFTKALQLNPTPDIQVYIVMDVFDFQSTLGLKAEGRDLVLNFKDRYYHELPQEMQQEFNAWLDLKLDSCVINN